MKHYTLTDFDADFPDDDACLEWIKEHRWPAGIRCRKCQRITKHHRVKNRTCYECDYCGTQVYPAADTIFRRTTTPLRSWFYAIYQIASTRGAISARELQRQLGVTYKTAWRIVKQVRSIVNEDARTRLVKVEAGEGHRRGKRPGAEVERTVLGTTQPKGEANTHGPGPKHPIARSDFETVLKAATKPLFSKPMS